MSKTIDFSAHYMVDGYNGVAFWLKRHATTIYEVEHEYTDIDGNTLIEYSYEEDIDPDMVIAVMVGDDREHLVHVSNLELLEDDDYCSTCGQIGCSHDGRE